MNAGGLPRTQGEGTRAVRRADGGGLRAYLRGVSIVIISMLASARHLSYNRRTMRIFWPSPLPLALLAGAALFSGVGPAAARAEQTAAPAPPPATLTAAQMSGAVSIDAMSVPTPGELFAALGKQIKPNWSAAYRGPLTAAYSDRAQLALNLGGLVADGYVAVEAQDSQQVKNLGKDILKLASSLGVSKEILERGKRITDFAEQNDWNGLREELEATQNEVKQAMEAKRDDELITLVSLGGWIRGTQVVSDAVLKNFTPQTASVLRQPAVVAFLRAKLDKLPARLQDEPLIKKLSAQLADIEKLVSFPLGGTASKEDVQKLNQQTTAMVNDIVTKI
ncbi:MAG: hypothetical protein JO295_11895 [Verrucomicrobia bacterium]|nr:hypothetical protein [Verrucomicrobiota bacterium]